MKQIIISTYIVNVEQITHTNEGMTIKGDIENSDSYINNILEVSQQVSDGDGINLGKWNIEKITITANAHDKKYYVFIKMKPEKL
jgi:hypothetical protein